MIRLHNGLDRLKIVNFYLSEDVGVLLGELKIKQRDNEQKKSKVCCNS